jgi:hypothetical protein
MKRNVGQIDRAIRIVAGVAILSLVFVGPRTLWGLIGLAPIVSGLVGWCPTYLPFGITTCRACSEKKG